MPASQPAAAALPPFFFLCWLHAMLRHAFITRACPCFAVVRVLTGRRHSLDHRSKKNITLDLISGFQAPRGTTLDHIAWDAEALRVLLKRMLDHCHASPADLLRKWGGGKKGLEQKQFTSHVYNSFFADESVTPEDLWVTEVAPVVEESFRNMMDTVKGSEGGSNLLQKVGIVHLQRCELAFASNASLRGVLVTIASPSHLSASHHALTDTPSLCDPTLASRLRAH